MPGALRIHATTAAEVESTWQDVVPSARLEFLPQAQVDFRWTSVTIEDFSAVGSHISADISASVEPEEQVVASLTTGPRVRLRTASADLDPSRPWLAYRRRVEARWEGECDVRALVFDRQAAARLAIDFVGTSRFELAAVQPTGKAQSANWARMHQHLMATLASLGADGVRSAPLIDAELRRHALVMTLLTFDAETLDAASHPAQRRPSPRAVRAAISFIDANLAEPLTVEDVARAANMTTRGVQQAFRRSLDTTPTAYLRRARLDAARLDLADDQTASVSAIAQRWGFTNVTRFRRAYHAAYGELPIAG